MEYGLCASVWSENSGVTHRVAQAIDVSSQYTVVVVGSSPIQGQLKCFLFMHHLLWTYCLALYSHACNRVDIVTKTIVFICA